MRILLITPMPPRPEARGAIPLVLHAQLTALRERNAVTVVTVAGDEPGEADAVTELERLGVDVHVVRRRRRTAAKRWRRRRQLASTWLRGRYPWRTVWFADPDVQETLDGLIRTRTFDVAAVEDNSMAVFRLPPDLPKVMTEHEVRRARSLNRQCGPPANWLRWGFAEADWRRWPAYQRSVWRRFDLIQVFTERDAAAVAELAPDLLDRVRVTPFGIDVPEALDAAHEESGLVLFVGNFTHAPNVDAAKWLVSEIMPRIRTLVPGVQLVLVGGEAAKRIASLARDDVQVVADVDAVAPWLEAASVVLAPVRTGGGMRMKVLQALASGKAVVTTPRGAEGFRLDGSEPPFVTADDADGIATATARLLEDEPLRRALGLRARRYAVEHFSGAAYARRLERVYAEAIAERGRSLRAAETSG